MRNRIIAILCIFATVLALAGCNKPETETSANTTIEESIRTEPLPKLKVGMMSAVDSAPFYHALQEGYFTQEGVDVELILFTNGQNRQTALQTGQVDGAMTDLVALITQTDSDFALTGTLSTDGDFPLLAKGSLDGKKSVTAGTMEISVTNYLLEQYLASTHEIEKVYINEIPARLEAVVSGQLDTGIFPEPFASIGALRGLEKIVFEGIPSESLNIIAFTKSAIAGKESAIRKFHIAYGQAVADLQRNPELARDVLMATIPNLPPAVRDTMHLPEYHAPRLPSDGFTKEIIAWTGTITGREYVLEPSAMLDPRFVRQ